MLSLLIHLKILIVELMLVCGFLSLQFVFIELACKPVDKLGFLYDNGKLVENKVWSIKEIYKEVEINRQPGRCCFKKEEQKIY